MNSQEHDLQLLALAQQQLLAAKLKTAFSPEDVNSRPTTDQDLAFRAVNDYAFLDISGGNQCLVKGTLVATPKGPVAIELIQPGDTVYDEHGKEIKVLRTFHNGPKQVADITFRGKVWASCTQCHVWQVETKRKKWKERLSNKFSRDDGIRRVTVKAPLGSVEEKHAYVIGALLGDGCSRQGGRQIHISSGISEVPERVAAFVGNTARKLHENNHTWSVGEWDHPLYDAWCKGRYAHQKIVDLDVLKTWNRDSLLRFVAGVIDTDGSIHPAKDYITIEVSMQAASVIRAVKYAFLALWQLPLSTEVDNRAKYKNGPVFSVYTRNAVFVRQVLKELDPYLVSPQKKWRPEYETLGGKRTRETCISAEYGRNPRTEETYDIHVDSPTNLYLLANGLVTHNSGKSQWGARNMAWFMAKNHPYVDIDKKWPNQRILGLLLAQTTKLYEEHWESRIRPFFDKNDYREKMQGGILQSVNFSKFNSKLLFFSYENPYQARDRVQGFTGHILWIDELCKLVDLYEEGERRMQKNGGPVIVTYTQKVKAPATKKYLKSPTPYKAHFTFNAFHNPAYDAEKKAKIEASLSQWPPEIREMKRKQILEGEYVDDDKFAYNYEKEDYGCDWPEHYSKGWRHIVAVDPAASGRVGYALLAEDPSLDVVDLHGKIQAVWYLVDSKYLDGEAPSDLVAAVEKEIAPYNIVRRIADGHESWFIKEAKKSKIKYVSPIKDNRKVELIKNPSEALKGGWLKVIDDGDSNEVWINEAGDALWKEDGSGIKNSTRFHVLDAFQYGYDKRPKRDEEAKPLTANQVLYLANKKRKKKEAQKMKLAQLRITKGRRRRR